MAKLSLTTRRAALLTVAASLVVAVGCKTKEIKLEPVDADLVCDALRWNQFPTKASFQSERYLIKSHAKERATSQEEVDAILNTLDATEANFREHVLKRCTSVPQRVFDCLPYAEETLFGLAGVVETQEKRSGVPKECKNATATLLEAIRPSKPPKTAKTKWYTKLTSSPIAVVQDSAGVYVVSESLEAFDLEGKPLWSESVPLAFSLAIHDETIIVFTKGGATAFDKSNGTQRWKVPAPEGTWLAAAILEKQRVYVLASSGDLLSYQFDTSCETPAPCLEHKNTLPGPSFKNHYQLLASADGASIVAITDSNAYVLDSSLSLQTMFQGHDQIPVAALTPSNSLVLGLGDEYILLDPKHCVADRPIALQPSPRLGLSLSASEDTTLTCDTCMAPPKGCEVARHHVVTRDDWGKNRPLHGTVVGKIFMDRAGHRYGASLDDFSLLWSHMDHTSSVGHVIPGDNSDWYELDTYGNVEHGDENGVSHSVTPLPWIPELPAGDPEFEGIMGWHTRGVGSVHKKRLAVATVSTMFAMPHPEFYLTLFGE